MKKYVFNYPFSLKLLLYIFLCILLCGCARFGNSDLKKSVEVYNLEKLCKVWGYVKYTHSAFLTGEKNWDEELLELIPIVSVAKDDEINSILHDWFVSLGEIYNGISRKGTLPSKDKVIEQADFKWINETYLGEDLATDLLQLKTIPGIYNNKSPVNYNTNLGVPDFTSEKIYKDMDYQDKSLRLLGLFRLWNAMEYNYPYLDILDTSWHDILPEHIIKMINANNRHSYELTLASLSANLQDAHISLYNSEFPITEFGLYGAPIELIKAEGRIIVWKVKNSTCPLKVGDIILKLEDTEIEDVIKHRKQYIATTTDDKIINSLGQFLIRSDNEKFEMTIIRDDIEMTITVKGEMEFFRTLETAMNPYNILRNNIGLINPAGLQSNALTSIMKDLENTNGIIIDFRQYPSYFIAYTLAEYLVDTPKPFALYATRSKMLPGRFVTNMLYAGFSKPSSVVPYNKKVVVLMNEMTQSQAEYTIMSIRNSKNVTVIGDNSVGSNGEISFLPLPGGINMMFTCQAVYSAEGAQIQRVGLTPDIVIRPTIAGIKEGRDELMEAAVSYILTESGKGVR